jgi:osmotically-inducible protein OsmY
MMKVQMWSGAVVLAVMTAACSDRAQNQASDTARDAGGAARETARDAGDAARGAGDAARDTARGAGDAVAQGGRAADAAVETMDVKMALTADSRVDASNINVDSNHNTKTVTLKGRVPTAAQKTIAEEIATKRAVGYRVVNDLTVGQ